MSTILDALKKVERERESSRDRVVHPEDPLPRQRRVPLVVIVACAALGFAAGIGLALWRSEAPVEVALLEPEVDAPAGVGEDIHPAAPAPPPAAGEAPPVGAAGPEAAPLAGALPNGGTSAGEPPAPATEVSPPVAPAEPPNVADAAPAAEPAPVRPDARPAARAAAGESALEPPPFSSGAGARVPRAADPAARPAPDSALEADPAERLAAVPPVDVPVETADPELEEPFLDTLDLEPEAVPSPEVVIDTGRSPPGTPRVALSFLQWSQDPGRRFAFISVDGGPAQRVQEGDTMGGLTVAQILPGAVQLRGSGTSFVIRPRH